MWKRFWRLSRSGTFEAFFDALAAMSETARLVQMLDPTVVRAHVSAAGAKGGSMIRRLAAGVADTLQIHLKTDFGGLPIAFHFTGGEASDSRNFETLLDVGPDLNPRAALGDKGYNSKSNRDAARNAEYPGDPYDPTPRMCPPSSRKHCTRTRHALNKLSASSNASSVSHFDAEDGAQFRLVRRACSQLHSDQNRPHGLDRIAFQR